MLCYFFITCYFCDILPTNSISCIDQDRTKSEGKRRRHSAKRVVLFWEFLKIFVVGFECGRCIITYVAYRHSLSRIKVDAYTMSVVADVDHSDELIRHFQPIYPDLFIS